MCMCLGGDPKKHCLGRREVREEKRKQTERMLSIMAPIWAHGGLVTLGNSGRQRRQKTPWSFHTCGARELGI